MSKFQKKHTILITQNDQKVGVSYAKTIFRKEGLAIVEPQGLKEVIFKMKNEKGKGFSKKSQELQHFVDIFFHVIHEPTGICVSSFQPSKDSGITFIDILIERHGQSIRHWGEMKLTSWLALFESVAILHQEMGNNYDSKHFWNAVNKIKLKIKEDPKHLELFPYKKLLEIWNISNC